MIDAPALRAAESLDRFAPMHWLLCEDDVRFFDGHPAVARRFRRDRHRIFLGYLRDLHAEIVAFHRESLRLIAQGAWDLMAHFCRKRAILMYHEARLRRAALLYRWAGSDVSAAVRGSLDAIVLEVGRTESTATA